MRKNNYIIVLFVILTFSMIVYTPTQKANAKMEWGLTVHQFIAQTAVENLDAEWKILFESFVSTVKGGSIYPDSLHSLGDTPNHLYYPSEPDKYTGPQTIAKWHQMFLDNLTINIRDAIYAGSVMSHYWADLHIPVHTGDYWFGHNAYESDINQYYKEFTLGPYTEIEVTNVTQMAIDAATDANQYYDQVRAAYPTSERTDAVNTDADLQSMTAKQMTKAISGLISIWKAGLAEALAPTITKTSTNYALIDTGHDNDYSIDKLVNIGAYLNEIGYDTNYDSDGLTASDLTNVDFLIVTALGTNYTADELTVVSDWLASGSKSLFVTGKGDFSNDIISRAGINDFLENVGTSIRMNDDNVYTTSNDPYYYQGHYIYTENTEGPGDKLYYDVAQVFHLFSPNSLFYEGASSSVEVLVNGAKYNYQTNQNAPAIDKEWDITDDDTGGEVIPLIAADTVGDDRMIIFGETSFSDFSFVPSGFHDNLEFLPTMIEWVLFDKVSSGYSVVPKVELDNSVDAFEGRININYKTSANVAKVIIFVDNVEKDTDISHPFDEFTFDLEPGTYTIKVTAENANGIGSSDTLEITVTALDTSDSPISSISDSPSPITSVWDISWLILLLPSSLVYMRKRNKK